jgi:UDPglucose 6-dehydrogenase
MTRDREPIGVIGTGYVGLVTAAGFAELGSDVYCIDIDEAKIAGLRRGEIPIYEPGLAELVAANAERLHFSMDIADALEHARLLFVAVGTPPLYSGDADLSAVYSVVDAMPPTDRHALVMKSTVPVGTGEAIKRRFAETGKHGFRYVSCPEFLKEGSAVPDFLHPDRVVVGDEGDWAGDAVVDLYAPLDAPLVRTDVASAEMVKLASNAFLATKISFINEIANVCEETGADVTEVARGMGLDDRIGTKFLQAGIGFGGSCLAPDETVLVRWKGRTELLTFEVLWESMDGDELEVLAYVRELGEALFLPAESVSRRDYEGEMLTLGTEGGRSVTVTPDHPLLVSDGLSMCERRFAADVVPGDWVPVAVERTEELVVGVGAGSQPFRSLARMAGQTPQPIANDASVRVLADAGVVGEPHRRTADGEALVRLSSMTRDHYRGFVYSLEVPGPHAFVTTGGIAISNCFPKDVSALKQLAGNSGYHFQLLNAVIEVNELQKRRVIGKLNKHLGDLVGKRIALLGLAFKPNTDDMREASSLVLSARLQAAGAEVSVYDPIAEGEARELINGVRFATDALDCVAGADAVVLVTEWAEFRTLDWAQVAAAMVGSVIVDGRNALDPAAVAAAGLTYEGIGRSTG